MNKKTDQKIKNILADYQRAQEKAKQFSATEVLSTEKIEPTDIFEMGLALDNKKRIRMDYELALAEKNPNRYSNEEIEYFKSEKRRLTKRIRAWQNRQFPSKNRE